MCVCLCVHEKNVDKMVYIHSSVKMQICAAKNLIVNGPLPDPNVHPCCSSPLVLHIRTTQTSSYFEFRPLFTPKHTNYNGKQACRHAFNKISPNFQNKWQIVHVGYVYIKTHLLPTLSQQIAHRYQEIHIAIFWAAIIVLQGKVEGMIIQEALRNP